MHKALSLTRNVVSGVLAVLIAGASALYSQTTTSTIPVSGTAVKAFAPLDQAILSAMQTYDVPGMTLGIISVKPNSKGVNEVTKLYSRGYGYADPVKKTAVTPNSLFRLASISKALTATAAEVLIAQGKMKYTDAFSQLDTSLSPLRGDQETPLINTITIWDLENHISGFGDSQSNDITTLEETYGLPGAPPSPETNAGVTKGLTSETWMDYELSQPLANAPGSTFLYSNFGYDILGETIQEVSGMPYETFVQKDLLKPLGMTNTYFAGRLLSDRLSNEVTYTVPGNPQVVPVYAGLPSSVPQQYGGLGGLNWGTGSAAGGWVSNTSDLLQLVASVTFDAKPALFTTYPTRPDQEGTNPVEAWAFSGLPYGTGWSWEQDGGMPGTTTILHIENNVAWCILINSSFTTDGVTTALNSAVLTAIQPYLAQ